MPWPCGHSRRSHRQRMISTDVCCGSAALHVPAPACAGVPALAGAVLRASAALALYSDGTIDLCRKCAIATSSHPTFSSIQNATSFKYVTSDRRRCSSRCHSPTCSHSGQAHGLPTHAYLCVRTSKRAVLPLPHGGGIRTTGGLQGQPNVSYIASRYYRAPELIFESTMYTTAIGANPTGHGWIAQKEWRHITLPCRICRMCEEELTRSSWHFVLLSAAGDGTT